MERLKCEEKKLESAHVRFVFTLISLDVTSFFLRSSFFLNELLINPVFCADY